MVFKVSLPGPSVRWKRMESGSGGANGGQDDADGVRPRNVGRQNGVLNEQQGKGECMVAVLLQNSGYLDNK